MKDWSILPALIEVIDGDWVFTISVAMVGDEEVRKGRAMGESTRVVVESHSGTGGEGRRIELDQQLEVVFVLGKLAERRRKKKGGRPDVLPVGTRAKRGQAMGNNWFSLNSKKLNFGPIGTEMAGVATAGGDEAFSDE